MYVYDVFMYIYIYIYLATAKYDVLGYGCAIELDVSSIDLIYIRDNSLNLSYHPSSSVA